MFGQVFDQVKTKGKTSILTSCFRELLVVVDTYMQNIFRLFLINFECRFPFVLDMMPFVSEVLPFLRKSDSFNILYSKFVIRLFADGQTREEIVKKIEVKL